MLKSVEHLIINYLPYLCAMYNQTGNFLLRFSLWGLGIDPSHFSLKREQGKVQNGGELPRKKFTKEENGPSGLNCC